MMLFFILWISRDISKSLKLKNDIIRAKERVDRLLKVKEQFVAHMSHEIRTPLTSIIGFSEQLSGMLKKEEELVVSGRILLSAEHLNGLINNVSFAQRFRIFVYLRKRKLKITHKQTQKKPSNSEAKAFFMPFTLIC